MRYGFLSPFLQPQVLFTTNESQSYVFGGRNHPLHINSQKSMLEDYARRNGFPNPTHFTDDGISGTRFDRPGFTAMMEEVEAGNVEAIIIKDMSRLGRDYLKVGQVMEILRQRGVRLIAINDGVDSANGENDFTPFLNICMNFTPEIPTVRLNPYSRQKV